MVKATATDTLDRHTMILKRERPKSHGLMAVHVALSDFQLLKNAAWVCLLRRYPAVLWHESKRIDENAPDAIEHVRGIADSLERSGPAPLKFNWEPHAGDQLISSGLPCDRPMRVTTGQCWTQNRRSSRE